MRPRNVHFTLTKMAIANQTQLTPLCFGYDRAAICAPSRVGELSVTLRDLPHTLFGGLRAPCMGSVLAVFELMSAERGPFDDFPTFY